jgi:hypothetical protein
MIKHTPGPWWFSETMPGQFRIGQGDAYIATVHGPRLEEGVKFGVFDAGDDRANARLIAAAPDLLKAAQAMLACCYDLERNDETLEAVKVTMKAIAVATGEQP